MWDFPERYYNDQQLCEYFYELTDYSARPCLFHGRPLTHARHGYKMDYEAELINKIASHPMIIGMKEESSHMAKASQVIKNVDTKDFAVIVTGGSMNRFEMQQVNGACSFTTGVGSLFPEFALNYFDLKTDEKEYPVREFLAKEEACFETLSKMGWHLGFRTALQEMGFHEPNTRSPFPLADEEQREEVGKLVEQLASSLNLTV